MARVCIGRGVLVFRLQVPRHNFRDVHGDIKM
nr:MAG TPA: hypothetical protein [Caudoviricetes sp.]